MDISTLLIFLGGVLLGGVLIWLFLQSRLAHFQVAYAEKLIAEKYITKEAYHTLEEQTDVLRADYNETRQELRAAELALAEKNLSIQYMEEQFQAQKEEAQLLRKQAHQEFELLAAKLLSEKSQQFTLTNKLQMQEILTPLKEKIGDFKKELDQKFAQETDERISLREEIKHLRSLNLQLSSDANNLAKALKGDNKLQGNWGEIQLERLLENTGLKKKIHFSTQFSATAETGKTQRPDFIIHLPDNKHLIIDSKVSLKDFDRFYNEESADLRKQHLKAHVRSIRQHIKDLGHKEYQKLPNVRTPDFIILFVPIEPAFAIAIQEDPSILTDALEQNIVLVTTSTLLATLRTVSFLWQQDKQSKSVQEIAKVSGQLYDKFAAFIEDMQNVGKRLDSAQNHWQNAMNKLSQGKRFGDTMLGKAEKIKELGARTSKSIQLPEILSD